MQFTTSTIITAVYMNDEKKERKVTKCLTLHKFSNSQALQGKFVTNQGVR